MHPGHPVKEYFDPLVDPQAASIALRVALVVGSVLFLINHGAALLQGEMNCARWISACLTYLVPFSVNIHGQYVSRARARARQAGLEYFGDRSRT